MAEKLPWFPFYAADWLADGKVIEMTIAEKGAYIHLLAVQWQDGPLPPEHDRLRRIIGVSEEEFAQLLAMLERCFVEVPGGLVNQRLESVRKEQLEKRKRREIAGSKGGKAKAIRRLRAPSNALALLQQSSSKNVALSTESELELESEKKKSIENTKVFSRRSGEQTDWSEVIRLWNNLAEEHDRPRIKSLSKARKAHYRTRLKEAPKFWFIIGRELERLNDFAKTGGWLTFDWIIKSPDNFAKLSEGQYRDNGRGKGTSDQEKFQERLANMKEEDLNDF